jgi:hypothetical protein
MGRGPMSWSRLTTKIHFKMTQKQINALSKKKRARLLKQIFAAGDVVITACYGESETLDKQTSVIVADKSREEHNGKILIETGIMTG